MNTEIFLIETLSNLHVGSGEINYGLVDNLIQRDPVTDLPTINSSSLKGALREHFERAGLANLTTIFGSEPKENDASKRRQGAIRFFEADMLSLPVRTTGNNLAFVNATSKELLKRQEERLKQFEIDGEFLTNLSSISKSSGVVEIEDLAGKKDYFDTEDNISVVGKHIAFVSENELDRLCDNEHLPIISRNCLENGQSTNLFYEQVLPRYSYLITLIMGEEKILDDFCGKLDKQIVQVGGNATIGYGYCKFTHRSTNKNN
jgi:CRISPR-associated protein Cmr4